MRRRNKLFGTKRSTRLFDQSMLIIGMIAPLALVPQVWQTYASRDVAGLSLSSWAILGVVNFLWMIYGIVHKQASIIAANACLALLNALVVLAIFMYR